MVTPYGKERGGQKYKFPRNSISIKSVRQKLISDGENNGKLLRRKLFSAVYPCIDEKKHEIVADSVFY